MVDVQYLIIANNGCWKQRVTGCCVTQKVSHIPRKTAIFSPSSNKRSFTHCNENKRPSSFFINLLLYFLVRNSEPYSCHTWYLIRILREMLQVKSLTNTVCTSERTRGCLGLVDSRELGRYSVRAREGKVRGGRGKFITRNEERITVRLMTSMHCYIHVVSYTSCTRKVRNKNRKEL